MTALTTAQKILNFRRELIEGHVNYDDGLNNLVEIAARDELSKFNLTTGSPQPSTPDTGCDNPECRHLDNQVIGAQSLAANSTVRAAVLAALTGERVVLTFRLYSTLTARFNFASQLHAPRLSDIRRTQGQQILDYEGGGWVKFMTETNLDTSIRGLDYTMLIQDSDL